MLADVLTSTGKALWKPSVLVPSAVATVGAWAAFRALEVERGFWNLPWPTMQLVAVVVVARFWASLTVTASALRVMRRGFQPAPVYWVPATTAFQVAVVSVALTIPILAFALFLIVPGVWLALRWSQAALLILDAQADWFDSADISVDLTAGRKLEILVVWLGAGVVFAVAGWLGNTFTEMAGAVAGPAPVAALPGLALAVVADAFGLVVAAAIYFQLDTGS